MPSSPALISWIGDVDLVEFIRSLPESKQDDIKQRLRVNKERNNFSNIERRLASSPTPRDTSPICTLLNGYGKDLRALFLITNRIPEVLEKEYFRFLKGRFPEYKGSVNICDVSRVASNIADLKEIYKATQDIIEHKIRPNHTELYCNLTSGAGVTASALVMLTSAFFDNYHICQTYEQRISYNDTLPQTFSDLIRKRRIHEPPTSRRILGESAVIKDILEKSERIARYDYSLLILGPSGTGKSTLAREIHERSPRKDKPFVEVNCGGITSTLLESRLFGHKKGTFTDAKEDKDGEFKNANGGTLFLDEIADCDPIMQKTILEALQPKENDKPTMRTFKVMGGGKETSDVRIIAATNKPIEKLVKEGDFREDLFYRLATTRIIMPSLAERPEDIELLAKHHLETINLTNDKIPGYVPRRLSSNAIEKLKRHTWPGNVRELQNVLQESVIFTDGPEIIADDINFHVQKLQDAQALPEPEEFSLEGIIAGIERRYIEAALVRSGGNRAEASRILGMKTPQNLESRIKALNNKVRG